MFVLSHQAAGPSDGDVLLHCPLVLLPQVLPHAPLLCSFLRGTGFGYIFVIISTWSISLILSGYLSSRLLLFFSKMGCGDEPRGSAAFKDRLSSPACFAGFAAATSKVATGKPKGEGVEGMTKP